MLLCVQSSNKANFEISLHAEIWQGLEHHPESLGMHIHTASTIDIVCDIN